MNRLGIIVLFGLFALSVSSTRSADISTNLPPDNVLNGMICGTWIHDPGAKDHITLDPDNTFYSRWQWGAANDISYQGIWKIKNGLIMYTCTRSNSVPFTNGFSCKIISVDESNLVFIVENMKISLIRKY